MRSKFLPSIRFGVIGLSSNLLLYLIYLKFTNLGIGHKFAMSLHYIVGVLQTFVLNKNWTFSLLRYLSLTFMRYISLYTVGYLINLGVLFLMVDRLGYSHKWVQIMTVPVVALLLFVMQKTWVFRFLVSSVA